MNVKRINWEKLDNKNVENTIWEQVCMAWLSLLPALASTVVVCLLDSQVHVSSSQTSSTRQAGTGEIDDKSKTKTNTSKTPPKQKTATNKNTPNNNKTAETKLIARVLKTTTATKNQTPPPPPPRKHQQQRNNNKNHHINETYKNCIFDG